MKILFIGDPHLKVSRLEDSKKLLTWIESIARQEKVDMAVNLGDAFHNHAVLRSEIMCEFNDHIHRMTKICRYIYLLGNHDMWKPDCSKYNAIKIFNHENFTAITKTTNICDITFVPYIHNYKEFPLETNKICVAHQTFVGADYGYYRPDVGADADKISADIIISGHIHKRQSFGKVIYPGSPMSDGIVDIDQEKGVMIFDTKTYEYRFITSPFPMWRSMAFDLSETTINNMNDLIKNNITEKDHWVIKIAGPKAEIVSYLSSKQWKELNSSYSIKVKPEYKDNKKVFKTQIKSLSVKDVLDEYIKNIYDGSLEVESIRDKVSELFANTD